MIDLEGVSKIYGRGPAAVTALRDVDLTIRQGEFVAVIGPSGSGKSTLLNLIGCLDRPSSGRHTFLGHDTGRLSDSRLSRLRNRSIGFVFQSFNLVPELTLHENVELPLVYAGVRRGRRARTKLALALVGLGHRADHRAGLLSGGEQQRAAVARALVNEPDLILADEPTGSIDAASSKVVLDLLVDLHNNGRTVVLVTHNRNVAAAAQRGVLLANGSLRREDAQTVAHRPRVPRPTRAGTAAITW